MCSLVEQLPAGNQITLSAMSAKPAVLWTTRADMWSAQVIFTIRSRRNPRGKDNDHKKKKQIYIVYFAMNSLVRLVKGAFLEHLTARKLLNCNFLPMVPWCPRVPSRSTTLQHYKSSHGH